MTNKLVIGETSFTRDDDRGTLIKKSDGVLLESHLDENITLINPDDGRKYEIDFINKGVYIKAEIKSTCP